MRAHFYLGFLTVIFTITRARAAPQNVDEPESPDNCECYVVSGPEEGYFQHYRFYDFRSVEIDLPAPEEADPWPSRNVLCYDHNSCIKSLEGTEFLHDWDVQDWSRNSTVDFPVSVVNSYENVFISSNSTNSTFLTLRTTRREDYASTAEVETRAHNIFRCSLRVRLRLFPEETLPTPDRKYHYPNSTRPNSTSSDCPIVFPDGLRKHPPPSGAVAGVFTYHSFDTESDLEILTSDPPYNVRYSNQPDYDPATDKEIPGASTIVRLPVPWTTWANHRLDWFPNISRWYLNDAMQLEKEYSVPKKPSMLVLNLWTDGGVWSGNMTVGSSVFMGVEYIEVAYNISESADIRPLDRSRSYRQHGLSKSSGSKGKLSRNRMRRQFGDDDDAQNDDPDSDQGTDEEGDEGDENDENDNFDEDEGDQDADEPDGDDDGDGDLENDEGDQDDGEDNDGHGEDEDEEDDEEERECQVVCRIDGVQTPGVPEIIYNSRSPIKGKRNSYRLPH